MRQSHAAFFANLPEARRLEAQFDQPRRHHRRQFRKVMIGGQIFCQQPDHAISIPPRSLQHLVRRSMEVDSVDIRSVDRAIYVHGGRRDRQHLRRRFRQPDATREVRGRLRLRLIRECAAANQAAIGHQFVRLGMNADFNRYRARFVSVELERRKERYFFDGFDMPARKHAQRSFCEGFDAHHTREHGRAVNLVIV